MTKTTEQLTKAIDAKLEILKITMEIEKRNITSANRLRNALKKKVDEVHSLKITVEENRFEAEEDKEGILEWSAQIEERVGEFEKAELANKGFKCAEMETTAKEEEERAEKKGRNSTMK